MKKIYISIHSGYSLDMTTSSTPPSLPPPLLHVLTPGRRAGAECWQGGILEVRRNCFVLIKGLCKFTTRNKSPPGPMPPSFPPLQQTAAVPSVSDPRCALLLVARPLPCPGPSLCPSAGEESRQSQRCTPEQDHSHKLECRKPFLPPHTFEGLANSCSWENTILQTQGGGRMSISPFGSLRGCDLTTWCHVLTLSQAGTPGSAAPLLKARCSWKRNTITITTSVCAACCSFYLIPLLTGRVPSRSCTRVNPVRPRRCVKTCVKAWSFPSQWTLPRCTNRASSEPRRWGETAEWGLKTTA